MSGDDFSEEAMLAAVKTLKTTDLKTPMAQTPPDRTSIGDFSVEQSSSLGTLFQQHHARVFRTAHRVTGCPADAEDVLQTVFLRLARGQEWPAISQNPEGYFARAAINASLDLLRGRKRSRIVPIDDLENRASGEAVFSRQNPETRHEDRELRELIRAAVSRLGPSAAQMFVLRYYEGHSNGDIARLMETSALVVGVTLHRARARLRTEIGRYLQNHPQITQITQNG